MHNKLIHTNINDFTDYLKDESRLKGTALSISFPQNREEILAILKIIKNEQKKITIQGARTGITGGAVPQDGHVLNLSRMNRILGLSADKDKNWFYMKVQPGLVLSDLQSALSGGNINTHDWDTASLQTLRLMKEKGVYFFPPDPTEPSASIGGMIACNASGACSFLYGPTRSYIESLKIILTDGSMVSLKRGIQKSTARAFLLSTSSGKIIKGNLPAYVMPTVKNASGYFVHDNMDLIDLFIGSEGTLGIIIEAEIKLIPKPVFSWGLTCFFPEEDQALDFVRLCRGDSLLQSCEKLLIKPAAIEFFDSNSLALLAKMKGSYAAFSSLPQIPEISYNGVYVEFHGDNEEILNETLLIVSDFIKKCGGDEEITWFATEPHELEQLRFFRHAVPEAVNLLIDMKKKEGLKITKLGTDMAVQNNRLHDVYWLYKKALIKNKLNYVMWGHIGNNHIHVNLLPESEEEYNKGKEIYKAWAKEITRLGGTVSAEHGIGKLKTDFLTIMYAKDGVREMREVKKIFDPGVILNPGNLFSVQV